MFGKKDNNKNNDQENVVESNGLKNMSKCTCGKDCECHKNSPENTKLNQDECNCESDDKNKPEEKQANIDENNYKETIVKLEEENKKLKDTLMRTLAELDNTRRRSIEENEKTSKYAISRFAEDLIPVMEDFYLAFNSTNESNLSNEKIAKSFFDGIKLTQNELKKAFEKNGMIRLFPKNEDFNPDFHNAISQVEAEDVEDNKIMDVMQAGYKIKERLLRPALVVVSKSKNK